ncbi:MAG TPA: hypothetical protein VFB67_09505 [Candidatus Polarisedimenticolaceae bacterium]|nr:hypothetical protein [Candidatus Polarisedimenticolaceae bacterium]
MRRALPSLLLLSTLAAGALPASEEITNVPGTGNDRVGIRKADPTNAGTFDGTWMYVNRDARYAMWIRTKDGASQIKIQYQSLAGPESFETDWTGKATYYLAGNPVTFDLSVVGSDPDKISGKWNWNLVVGTSGRRESADLVLQRTGYGRNLLMDFRNYERTFTRNGQDKTVKLPNAWNWNKISKRELLWDELPF